jgi:adenine-specific DNA-methyltransferase
MQQYESLNRLKDLFRELLQLDTADLDFGLYRLFRLKRTEIEAFLDKQLPAEVDQAFEAVTGDERERLRKQVVHLAKQARESVADDAILPSGESNPKYTGIKAVKEYVEARERIEGIEATEAQRAEVFNHLYAFFSRYYDEGDFIPRRFFGARSAYAVPYNGEEVLFHWANRDQYYVKSGEAFRDYVFTLSSLHGEYRVRFKLVEATTSKDNTKGDTRFFFPRPNEMVFDKNTRILTIPFEYRLPTESEAARYGAKGKAQEAILDAFEGKILDSVSDSMLKSCLVEPSPTGREKEGETPLNLLRRRLTHFTKKNTADFFVHKNLGAFLRQELEFFIRDQIVHEADLEGDFETKRRMLRVFRKLSETVITFLAQIEEAQKRLFEKKKFVLRTDYLVPIQNVPRELWKDVLANKAQLEEWKELFSLAPKSDLFNLKGKMNEHVLGQHPTLVVDTRHFSPYFTARLLEAIEDLDEWTDGVLIHSENFQALNLMQARYREQVKCIYIDPPYNTGSDEFLYKDAYQASSWASMLIDRAELSKRLLTEDGLCFLQIGDEEQVRSRLILDLVFIERKNTVVVRRGVKNVQAQFSTIDRLAGGHDVIHVYVRTRGIRLPHLRETHQIEKAGKWDTFWRGTDRSTMRYELFGQNPKTGQWRWEESRARKAAEHYEFYLKNQATQKSLDEWYVESLQAGVDLDFVRLNDEGVVQYYVPPQGYRLVSDNWLDVSAAGSFTEFPTEKHDALLSRVISWNTGQGDFLVDYFAGSGTTGHAVINLNREDGGQRKFILVEMADYFDTVLVPRIKKVMFTPEWKEGKPKRLATKEEAERTPRLVKVLRLESYEDALHNTFSDSNIERLSGREKAYRQVVGDEEYRIRYLVKLPLEASDSMLSLAKLEHPFDYTIETLSDYGSKAQTVDLVETFNWLYGLRVRRFFTWVNKDDKTNRNKEGRLYRAVLGTDREGKKRVLVVWRDMTGLDPVKDREFLETKAKEIGPFEEQWVNGDSAAKGFASLDALFKRLMAGGEA